VVDSDKAATIIQVQCYAGRKADERQVRFRIGDRDFMVGEIVEQWYGPDNIFYKLRADDHNLYLLSLRTSNGIWRAESLPPARTA
jgi:hypothetical protein